MLKLKTTARNLDKYWILYRNFSRHKSKILGLMMISENIVSMQYAIRGPLLTKANQLESALRRAEKLPFDTVVYANNGDSQKMGQKPLTFVGQVLSTMCYPELLDHHEIPDDAKKKASILIHELRGESLGSMVASRGIPLIREHVAKFIENRDGHPSNPDDIFLFNGATEGIMSFLKMLSRREETRSKKVGIMLPVPMYPLYSAMVVQLDMVQVKYHLVEVANWNINIGELRKVIVDAKKACKPRAIVFINPNNPTGSILSQKMMQDAIKFAHEERLVIIADEVYQENVYIDKPFLSFKKVMSDMQEPYNRMELISFCSVSKGSFGECGFRGGFCEMWNFDPQIKLQFEKLLSLNKCPNTPGQIVVDCLVDPPRPPDPSYRIFMKEKQDIHKSLKERGNLLCNAFAAIDGYKCNKFQGAMYAYPSFVMPDKAIRIAKEQGMKPDVFYVIKMLEATGICVIPGSGFDQDGTDFYLRSTVLPQKDVMENMIQRIEKFHKEFKEKYAYKELIK